MVGLWKQGRASSARLNSQMSRNCSSDGRAIRAAHQEVRPGMLHSDSGFFRTFPQPPFAARRFSREAAEPRVREESLLAEGFREHNLPGINNFWLTRGSRGNAPRVRILGLTRGKNPRV